MHKKPFRSPGIEPTPVPSKPLNYALSGTNVSPGEKIMTEVQGGFCARVAPERGILVTTANSTVYISASLLKDLGR
jgi:hypothetical protein